MASKSSYAIKVGERILVTGANGFIGSNIADLLLSLGYLVRGTVRSDKLWLQELFDSKYGLGRFELVEVPVLHDKKALAAVLGGVSGVVHTASDLSFSADPNKVIPHVVAAIEAVLEASSRVNTVKRIVLTSSSAAAVVPEPGEGKVILKQDTWNESAIKAAWDENTSADIRSLMVYAASKAEGERAAFDWVNKNKPRFVLNSVLPDYTIGEVLHSNMGSTGLLPAKLLEGNEAVMNKAVAQYLVDVKDIARLHAIGLFDLNVRSERLFGLAIPYTWKEVVDILRELRPSSKTLVTKIPPPREGWIRMSAPDRSSELLTSFFGQPGWTSLEDSMKAGITSLGL